MLEVDISAKRFLSSEGKSIEVLRDLHFSCAADSFTCIVGPSGCGKTTTLRCILGLDTEYEGRVSTTADGTQGQMISAVFQEPRLLPWRTVEQNVRLPLKNKKSVSRQRQNAELDALFAELGLETHREFFPTELSLGLARRVGLARAFAVKPSVLILDEPFVSLDEKTASRLRKLLLNVWSARSCTALMVTHNLSEAIELADRILFFSGSPSTVIHDFTNPLPRAERNSVSVSRVRDELLAQGIADDGLTDADLD